jgi:hypothetical protein
MVYNSSSQFYLSSYFLINILLLLAYPILRLYTSAGKRDLKRQDYFGFSYENSIIYTALILAVMGYSRSTSTRGFISDLFSVGKVGVTALLVFAKVKFAIIYAVVCLVLWMVVPYPKYVAQNRFVRVRSVEQFDDIINEYKQEQSLKVSNNKKTRQNL